MDLVAVSKRAPGYACPGAGDERQSELAASIHKNFGLLAETLRRGAEASTDPAEVKRLRVALTAARKGRDLAERLLRQLGD
jgi:hypothetical protein